MSQDLVVISKRSHDSSRQRLFALCGMTLFAAALIWIGGYLSRHSISSRPHPPWVYGLPNTRFTVIEFADLECAYCGLYFPQLRAWVDAHPEVNWEWHHLPLAAHEPAATQEARLAECAGEVGGAPLFWSTVDWLYSHPDRASALSQGIFNEPVAQAIRACLRSERPGIFVRTQAAEATQERITATPTVRVVDRRLGHSVTLTGLVPPDALSSVIDGLAASTETPLALKR
jgi:protein-disulfide isomerase